MSCECGCGGEPAPGRRFIKGHTTRVNSATRRIADPASNYDVDENGCHVWRGGLSGAGYAVMADYRKPKPEAKRRPRVYVHRFVWEEEHGPIPKGLTIDHLCNNPICINVEHMRLVTQAENARRGQIRRWHGVDPANHPALVNFVH